jgi:hypothetical protein
MDIYFSTRGIKPSVIDNKYVTFKKKDWNIQRNKEYMKRNKKEGHVW